MNQREPSDESPPTGAGKIWKRLLWGLILALVSILIVMAVRTWKCAPRPAFEASAEALGVQLDPRRVCERLSQAIQIPSVSAIEPSALDLGRMNQMVDFIEETFAPLVRELDYERHPAALVFRWQGLQPDLAPLLLLAHLDVVPVDPGTESEWSQPPFSGAITAGYVWGRGAMDDKASALAILEALEHLLVRGHRPERGVIVAIGLDEEIGGARGAAEVAQLFEDEGLRPHMILDEGFAVLEDIVDVVPVPIAGVGIAEKGALTIELEVSGAGGHSSMPEKETNLGILSRAISALESAPLPARLDGAPARFFDELAREMELAPRFLFANRWITEPILRRILDGEASTGALLRSTTAVTMARAGVASNVLPEIARATVNFRIHTRDSVSSVLEHVRAVVDDPRVEIEVLGESWEPSAVSPTEGEAWELLRTTIRECYPGVCVAPSLVLGGTDSRHYAKLSPNVYRFVGLRLGPDDLARLHGTNERIATRNYLELIRFYLRLITPSGN